MRCCAAQELHQYIAASAFEGGSSRAGLPIASPYHTARGAPRFLLREPRSYTRQLRDAKHWQGAVEEWLEHHGKQQRGYMCCQQAACTALQLRSGDAGSTPSSSVASSLNGSSSRVAAASRLPQCQAHQQICIQVVHQLLKLLLLAARGGQAQEAAGAGRCGGAFSFHMRIA